MTSEEIEELGYSVRHDLISTFVGTKINSGSYRDVYSCADRYSGDVCVIKIENKERSFRNIQEWEIWESCPKKWKRWLAPCHVISPCGMILIQSRVDLVSRRPKRIPDFLDDLKQNNWGLYKGRLVMCDYGHHRFFANGFRRARLKGIKDQWQT